MTGKDIPRWMRREHEKVDELSRELRQVVATVPRANLDNWISELRSRFDHFRAHLVKHMALEEREGYLLAVSEHRPTLSAQIDRLKHEHIEMQKIMEEIRRTLLDVSCEDRLMIRDCNQRIENLLAYVEHHENDENLLVTYVFTQDIGTKD